MKWTGGDQLLQDQEELREQARKDRAKLFEVILKLEPRMESWLRINWPDDFKRRKEEKNETRRLVR